MCPSVIEFITQDSDIDGARRVPSDVLDPVSDPSEQMTTDFSYGINGITYRGWDQSWGDFASEIFPSTSVGVGPGQQGFPVKKMSSIPESARMAFFFDGREWNMFRGNGQLATRLSGARHGDWKRDEADSTGTCNIAFMDGHAEGVKRNQLPDEEAVPYGEARDPIGGIKPVEFLDRYRGAIFRTDQG